MARVLVAEPSPDVRLLLRRVVARLGFEPVELDSARRSDPAGFDVLLLEPAMVGGLKLAQRARRRDPALPIVVCSIYSPRDDVTALEPVAHLVKPFRRVELEAALYAAARLRAAEPDAVRAAGA